METPDKTKTCPPSISTSLADFSPTMSSTCSTYHGCSGGGPPPLLGRFLALLNATPLRFNSNHIFFPHCPLCGELCRLHWELLLYLPTPWPVFGLSPCLNASTGIGLGWPVLEKMMIITNLTLSQSTWILVWNGSCLASAGEIDDYHWLNTFTGYLNLCLE